MLGDEKIMAFVGVRDPDRAMGFYRDTLGLHLVRDERPFALVFDAAGTMLRVSIVQKIAAAPYTVLGWHVTDIGVTVEQLIGAGVNLERFEGMGQDERGIWRSPSGARVAWFKD